MVERIGEADAWRPPKMLDSAPHSLPDSPGTTENADVKKGEVYEKQSELIKS